MSLMLPIVQLVILGYAFGGNVKHLNLAIVDRDRGTYAVKVEELAGAVTANAGTFESHRYTDLGQAVSDLRDGRLNGVLAIPEDFSRKTLTHDDPRLALIEDNTDNFVSATLAQSLGGVVSALSHPAPSTRRLGATPTLDLVEVYPYVPY